MLNKPLEYLVVSLALSAAALIIVISVAGMIEPHQSGLYAAIDRAVHAADQLK